MAVTGYTRQAAANISTGLTINAADHNAEYNQIQSAMDNTAGHDHSGAVSGSGQKITLTASVTGILPVANGGTGVTTSTGTTSVVLSGSPTITTPTITSPTITGTMGSAFNITTTGVMTAGGYTTTGAGSAFNFIDRTSSRGWAWYGTGDVARLYNGAGDVITISSVGGLTASSITAVSGITASSGNITASGGNVNISGSYQIGGVDVVISSGAYRVLEASNANGQVFVGNATDPTNYYRNTTHHLQTIAGGEDLATFVTTGSTIKGTTTNNNAPAGYVGEYTNSDIAIGSAIGLANYAGTGSNITALGLTAGDWDVWGSIIAGTTTAPSGALFGGFSSTSNAIPSFPNGGGAGSTFLQTAATVHVRYRVTLAGTTTIYLVAGASFSSGATSVYGSMSARRAR